MNMVTKRIGSFFALLLAGNAYAASPCNTLTECENLIKQAEATETQLQAGSDTHNPFEVIYVDKGNNGLKWSKKLPGTYGNGCTMAADGSLDLSKCTIKEMVNGTKLVGDDSAAAQACIKLGGRLPTIEEFENMSWDFPTVDNLKKTFGDMDAYIFWSSTVGPFTIGRARDFHGSIGKSALGHGRLNTAAVRCVGR